MKVVKSNYGIYSIVCKSNSVTYIGSTSVSFVKRWRKHKQRLRYNYHENSYLQHAWNKYGEDDFIFSEIEILNGCDDASVKKREGYWLKQFFPLGRDYCFNLSDHTCGGNTVKDDATRKKLSDSVKASYTPELRKLRSTHAIDNIDTIKETLSVTKKTDKWKNANAESRRKLARDPKWIEKMKKVSVHRHVPVHTNLGEYFESVTSAARETGAHRSGIRACINGKTKTCKDRKWFYT